MYDPYFNDPKPLDHFFPSRYGKPKKTKPEKVKKPELQGEMDVWEKFFKKDEEEEDNTE